MSGNNQTTSQEEAERMVSKGISETVAQKFYRLSGCSSKVEFAKKIGYHEMATRLYLLREDRKSRKPCNPNTLHRWARSLASGGGPRITIGLWPDGEITMQTEEDTE